jgi:membrane protease YdiL (CAAX protease family)
MGIQSCINGATPDYLAIQETVDAFLILYDSYIQLVTRVVCIIIFSLIWKRVKMYMPSYRAARNVPVAVMLTALAFFCYYYVDVSMFDLIRSPSLFQDYKQIAQELIDGGLVMIILVIGIAGPIAEEIVFRGILLNRLILLMPTWAAVLTSSIIFSVMHFDPPHLLHYFTHSIACSLLYLRYRNLWLPIIGHLSYNIATILLPITFWASGLENINGWLLLILSALVSGISVWLLLKHTKPAVPAQEYET